MEKKIEIHGMEILINESDPGFLPKKRGDYEKEGIEFLKEHVGDTFVDIGARYGWYGLHAAKYGAYTHFFEPSPCNSVIAQNISNNGLDGRVHAMPLSDKQKEVRFTETRDKFYETDEDGPIRMYADRLDVIMRNGPSIGVKVDTEGHEHEIIRGMKNIRDNIKFAIIEYHPEKSDKVDNCMGLLENWGWSLDNKIEGKEILALYTNE